jgi:hypothetical protein
MRHVAKLANLGELARLILDAPLAPSSTITALSTAVKVR